MSEECQIGYIKNDPILRKYHDEEWCKPIYDEQKLYALFLLELFQAGLSWKTILVKRENFRKAFDSFDVNRIACYDEKKIMELLSDPGIIRSRRKIEGAIINAQIVLEIQKEYGSFSNYLWHFTNQEPILESSNITTNALSDDVSIDLKKRGMKYAGSVTIYSFLQAAGIIYSHTKNCSCYRRDHASRWVHNQYKKTLD